MSQAFTDQGVVPKILPELPREILGVAYNHGKQVQPGDAVTRADTISPPTVTYSRAGEYVIIMVDPDLFKTDDPTGQVRHWVQIVNIGEEGTAVLGREITSYLPCTPGAGSGKHRYIFVLAEISATKRVEPDFIHAPNEDLKDRMGFYLDRYIESKSLTPVAANFMLVSADAKSSVQNLKAGGEALLHKVVNK